MEMSVPADGGDDVVSEINSTPLVDVMLVLLIIFLITIPVAITSIQVKLPKEFNQPRQSKPENVVLSVNRDGDIFWNELQIPNVDALVERLKKEAVREPGPRCTSAGTRSRATSRSAASSSRASAQASRRSRSSPNRRRAALDRHTRGDDAWR